MHIKSVITATVAAACLFPVSPTIAAVSERFISQETILQINDAMGAQEPKTTHEEPAFKKMTQTIAAVRVHVGHSRSNHRDARACLDEASNPAIIKCAEKYRHP